MKGMIETKNEELSMLEEICRIAKFSYEPTMAKYPFIKKYLSGSVDPLADWILWITAAGAGFVIMTEENYTSEHDEIINSIESVDGLSAIVLDFGDFMKRFYELRKTYSLGIGFWVLSKIKNDKPTLDELNTFGVDINELIILTVKNYETRIN